MQTNSMVAGRAPAQDTSYARLLLADTDFIVQDGLSGNEIVRLGLPLDRSATSIAMTLARRHNWPVEVVSLEHPPFNDWKHHAIKINLTLGDGEALVYFGLTDAHGQSARAYLTTRVEDPKPIHRSLLWSAANDGLHVGFGQHRLYTASSAALLQRAADCCGVMTVYPQQ